MEVLARVHSIACCKRPRLYRTIKTIALCTLRKTNKYTDPASMLYHVDHFVKMCCGVFDVKVLVLARPTFRRKNSAAMAVLEVPIRELIASFSILVEGVVDAQIPSAIFSEPVQADEFVFLYRRRSVFAPIVSCIVNEPALFDEFLRIVECSPV
jgi:hypothetical protein